MQFFLLWYYWHQHIWICTIMVLLIVVVVYADPTLICWSIQTPSVLVLVSIVSDRNNTLLRRCWTATERNIKLVKVPPCMSVCDCTVFTVWPPSLCVVLRVLLLFKDFCNQSYRQRKPWSVYVNKCYAVYSNQVQIQRQPVEQTPRWGQKELLIIRLSCFKIRRLGLEPSVLR
jgi:hypothetical protein